MLGGIVRYLWGDLDRNEMKKFGILGMMFFFLIGAYWLLRTQKNAVFNAIVGLEFQPKAKMLSLLIVVPTLLIYAKLVDLLDKNKLFIGLSSMYALGFASIAFLLKHPVIGLPNPVASPDRLFGWFTYIFIESFGSVMVGLFWAFVTSSTKTESAKKGYALIIAGSQVGSILGSYMSWKSELFGNAFLFNVGALSVCAIVPMILLYLWIIPAEYRTGSGEKTKKARTGIFEGIKILLTRPYVLGIFGLATLYEVVGTILDYQMIMLARAQHPTTEAFAAWNGMYGMMTNGLALVFAMVGTSFLMRRFGLRFCLTLFPIATAVVVSAVYINPVLWVVMTAMITIKGLSYALNNPSKEMMYIPTTKDVKFKAKSWIDMFGGRSSKAAGASVTNMFAHSIPDLLMYGTLISFGIIGVWFVVATFVGSTFKRLTDNDEVIE